MSKQKSKDVGYRLEHLDLQDEQHLSPPMIVRHFVEHGVKFASFPRQPEDMIEH